MSIITIVFNFLAIILCSVMGIVYISRVSELLHENIFNEYALEVEL